MVRQLTTQHSYIIENDGDRYIVTLETLNNNVYGTPRYKAYITSLSTLEHQHTAGAWRYTFTGHYFDKREEAGWILKQHLARCE